jgi:anaerobic magnesium-protoporphyrin IX monomethyl ester cyclase
MARILLVNPGMRQRAANFPNSLLPIAGYLLEKGHDVRLLDLQVEGSSEVDPGDYDIVGITSYTGSQIQDGLCFARIVRERASRVPIVWGGVHATLTARQTAQHPLVDIVVRGEGEATFLDIIDTLDHCGRLEDVEGVTMQVKGELLETPDRGYIDLDTLPFYPYHLVKPERYPFFAQEKRLISIQSSRGCPHNCGFCYGNVMHHRRWRSKSEERTVDELQYVVDYLGAKDVCFIDDNFSVRKSRVETIAKKIIDRSINCEWRITSRFDYIVDYEPELLHLLKKAGCNEVWCAGEFGSQRMLDLVDKNITPDIIREGMNKLDDAGLPSPIGFMAGYPTETCVESMATIDLVDELLTAHPEALAQISLYTPFPGTPLFTLALEHGFKEPASLDEWGRYKYGIVENLPWLSRRHRNMLRVSSLMVRSTYLSPKYDAPLVLKNRRVTRFAHRVLRESARLRWKHKFFMWAPEWRLVDLALKISNSWER